MDRERARAYVKEQLVFAKRWLRHVRFTLPSRLDDAPGADLRALHAVFFKPPRVYYLFHFRSPSWALYVPPRL